MKLATAAIFNLQNYLKCRLQSVCVVYSNHFIISYNLRFHIKLKWWVIILMLIWARFVCLFVFIFDLLMYDRLSAIVPGYRHAKYICIYRYVDWKQYDSNENLKPVQTSFSFSFRDIILDASFIFYIYCVRCGWYRHIHFGIFCCKFHTLNLLLPICDNFLTAENGNQ